MGIIEPEVLNKYQAAAQIANDALKALLIEVVHTGASIGALCLRGDQLIADLASRVYKDVKLKGLAFPTCLSPNDLICHYSPGNEEAGSGVEGDRVLQAGDLVKLELGAHVDGYPVLVATTVLVEEGKQRDNKDGDNRDGDDEDGEREKGRYLKRCADLLLQLSLRLFRVGRNSQDVARQLASACEQLGISFVEGVILHKLDRNDLNGLESESVVPHASIGQTIERYELVAGDVFVLDMAVTRESVVPRPCGHVRSTVYGKVPQPPTLRTKSGRALIAAVGDLAFHERSHPRMAIAEALGAKAVRVFPVMQTAGQSCARALATVLLSPNGPIRLGCPPLSAEPDTDLVQRLSIDLQALLQEPVRLDSAAKKARRP
jgi:methionine aminopeptidase